MQTPRPALLKLVTGANPEETRQVLGSFLALFCLIISYYLVKPLRNSQFLKEFAPTMLPWIYLVVSVLSFAITKIFHYWFERIGRRRLVVGTFATMMACKLVFTVWLPVGGQKAAGLFYLFGSVYFLLAIALLWACINDTFQPEQGERCYGFVALGATFGTILGSRLSSDLSGSAEWRPYALVFSAVFMAVSLAFLMAVYHPWGPPQERRKQPRHTAFFDDLRELWRDRYIRSIGVMVVALAIFNSSAEFLTQKVIDRRVAELEYSREFGADPNFEFAYNLKTVAESERAHHIAVFLHKTHWNPLDWEDRYSRFKDQSEARMRKLYSDIFLWQGILGMILLAVTSRYLFRHLGLQKTLAILPVFALIGLLGLTMPLSLLAVQLFVTVSGSLNYSLNNAAKELLFTATSTRAKFKQKPLIEGPGTRVGDALAALASLGLHTALPLAMAEGAFLLFCVAWVVYWLKSVLYAGRVYDEQRK